MIQNFDPSFKTIYYFLLLLLGTKRFYRCEMIRSFNTRLIEKEIEMKILKCANDVLVVSRRRIITILL